MLMQILILILLKIRSASHVGLECNIAGGQSHIVHVSTVSMGLANVLSLTG
jgi:hypothetical protein